MLVVTIWMFCRDVRNMKLNIVCTVITMLFVLAGCTPLEAQQTDKKTATKQDAIQGKNNTPNVLLTIEYDEAEVLPKPDELTILIDNRLTQGIAVDNKFGLYLDPGSYDVQISSVERYATRGIITVTENSIVQQSFTLKTEGWGLLGDYDIRLIGLSENRALDIENGLTFGVYDTESNLLPFDHISLIRVAKLKMAVLLKMRAGLRRALLF